MNDESENHKGDAEFGRRLQERRRQMRLVPAVDRGLVPAVMLEGEDAEQAMRQKDLAALCGVGEKAVQQWEGGLRLPTRDALLRLEAALLLPPEGWAWLTAPLRERLPPAWLPARP